MTPENESRKAGDHPAIKDLQRLMTGELSRPKTRAVVRHLLGGCPTCSRETRRLWRLGAKGAPLINCQSRHVRVLQ